MEKQIYFHLLDLNRQLDYRLPVNCTVEEFDEWEEHTVNNDTFIADMEAAHNPLGKRYNDYILVGFTADGADEDEMKGILQEWKNKLVELGWAKPEDEFTSLHIPDNEL